MAIHSLYVGGPATGNFSRAMFPTATFSATDAGTIAVRPAAHQGPNGFSLARVLDFKQEGALRNWYASVTLAQGDDLDLMLIPQDTFLTGIFVEVETPTPSGTTATGTLSLRGVSGATFGAAVNLAAAGKSYRPIGGTALTATAALGAFPAFYIAEPAVLSLDLTAFTPAVGLGDLRLKITAQVVDLHSGQM